MKTNSKIYILTIIILVTIIIVKNLQAENTNIAEEDSYIYKAKYKKLPKAKVLIVNKTTGKSTLITTKVNIINNIDLGRLSFSIKACYKNLGTYRSGSVMFIQIVKTRNTISSTKKTNRTILYNANKYVKYLNGLDNSLTIFSTKNSSLVFSGWMFVNYPEISLLKDPTYNLKLIECID